SDNLPVNVSAHSNLEIISDTGTLEKSSEISVTLDPTLQTESFNKKEHDVFSEVFTDPASLTVDKNVYRKDDPHIDPSFLFLQFSSYPDLISKDAPRPLPDDESTNRALTVLDHTPVVDFHKIGVLYVGKNQTRETEILSNIHGSQD